MLCEATPLSLVTIRYNITLAIYATVCYNVFSRERNNSYILVYYPLITLSEIITMKNQIMLVMLAMLVTVFVTVPTLYLTLVLNVGLIALLLTTLVPLAADAINLRIENNVRGVHSKNIVVKETDGNENV